MPSAAFPEIRIGLVCVVIVKSDYLAI